MVIGHGYFNNAAGNYVNGQIAGVQAYSRVLSDAKVSTVYGAGRSGGSVASSPASTTSWALDLRRLPTSQTDAMETSRVTPMTRPAGRGRDRGHGQRGNRWWDTGPGALGDHHRLQHVRQPGREGGTERQRDHRRVRRRRTGGLGYPAELCPGTTTPITATVVRTYGWRRLHLHSNSTAPHGANRYLNSLDVLASSQFMCTVSRFDSTV
jgi:hypothetical protein